MLLERVGDLPGEALGERLATQQKMQQASQQPPEDKAQHPEDVTGEDEQDSAIRSLHPVGKRRRTVQLVDEQQRRQTAASRDDERQIEDIEKRAQPSEERLKRLHGLGHERLASRRPG
jgi:hypothetical protein